MKPYGWRWVQVPLRTCATNKSHFQQHSARM
jgi:hypothetical protein